MRIHGNGYEVTWKKGELSGTPWAVELIQKQAHILDGEPVGIPCGPYTETTEEHLSSDLSVLIIAQEVLPEITGMEDGPKPIKMPKGAIP